MGLFPKRGRHYKKPALWKRIVKWTALSLLAIIVTVGLAGFIFVYRTLGKIGLNTEVIYEARQQLDIPLPDEPQNILVMGTDDSQDGAPNRSDTMMLVRANPRGEYLSVLSIPRDLIVDIPGYGKDKINAAYANGGVPLAIDTVRNLTGQPVHHFAVMNFAGFEKAVDAMGGVYVDIDRRYFNDNSDAAWGEDYEPIDIYPGYQKLGGHDTLAYVRYRHTDSDFTRIARQQYFIRDAKSQSLKWGNITRIPELADIFAGNTTSDVSKSEVLSLTRFLLGVNKERIYQAQVPVEEMSGGPAGSYFVVAKKALPEVMSLFQSPVFEKPEPPVPGAAPASVPSEKTKQVSIEVLNGNGVEGAAALAANLLQQQGCTRVEIGGNTRGDYTENQIYFREGYQDAAEELSTLLKPCKVSPMPPEMSTASQLAVIVGSSFEGQLTEKQPEVKAALHFEANSQNGRLSWQAAALQVPFKVQKPASFPAEFDYVEFHPYEIATDDGPRPALKVVCEDDIGNIWGIMETTFTDAPLLQQPSVERDIAGKPYRFFYAGDKLRYLAWQDGEAAYWITNTLQNSLDENTMIELAASFKPV